MTRDEMLQDLAYARTLAEEGRHAPLLGGAYLLFWGLLNLSAYLFHWGLLTERLARFGGSAFASLWTAYGVVAGVGMAILIRRMRDMPGKSAIGVRAERAVWSGVGVAMFVIVTGCLGRMALTGDMQAPNAIMGPAFACFGLALAAIAAMAGEKWLSAFAALSFAASIALHLFANAPWAYLLAAAASVVVLAIPGAILMRREPSALV